MKVSQARRLKELERENGRLKRAVLAGLDTGQADPGGSGQGKLLSPERRRRCVVRVRQQLGASERRACRVLGQPRTTQRRARKVASDEGALRGDIGHRDSRVDSAATATDASRTCSASRAGG